jgi:hypothetical protein
MLAIVCSLVLAWTQTVLAQAPVAAAAAPLYARNCARLI